MLHHLNGKTIVTTDYIYDSNTKLIFTIVVQIVKTWVMRVVDSINAVKRTTTLKH